jgi:polar amino acid transport system substrate-binding protein
MSGILRISIRLLAAFLISSGVCRATDSESPDVIRLVVRATPAFADRILLQPTKGPPRGGRNLPHQLDTSEVWERLILPATQSSRDARKLGDAVAHDLGYEGYSIHLWSRVINELNALRASKDLPPVQCTFVGEVGSIDEMVQMLRAGTADVGLGAITITEGRMQQVDFSFPIYESSYQVMIPADRAPADFSSLSVPFRQLLKWENLGWLLLIVGTLLVISHVVWMAERRVNARAFPDQYHRGIGETVWWSLSTLMSGGCEEKPVQGRAARFIALVWMFCALMFATFVQSTVTTSMVVGGGNAFHGLENFNPMTTKIGLVTNSSASDWLQKNESSLQTLPRTVSWENREHTLQALLSRKIDGWLHDGPILHSYASKYPGLKVLGKIYGPHSYAFMFRENLPLREEIDSVLVRLKSSGEFEKCERRWVGTLSKTRS